MAEQINGFRKEIRRVLICGLGSIGKRHFRILQEYWENIEIAILRSGHGPSDLSIELDNQIFYSLEEALAWKPDAAIIATPASEHFSTALPLARDGIPLLIEKPMTCFYLGIQQNIRERSMLLTVELPLRRALTKIQEVILKNHFPTMPSWNTKALFRECS